MSWGQVIPWAISGAMLIFAILTYARAGHKDEMKDKAEVQAKLEVLSEALIKANLKLDQVYATTNEMRADVKTLNNSLTEMDKRLSRVESDLKTAFMRIDELREEVKK